jgi:hypothetical protein
LVCIEVITYWFVEVIGLQRYYFSYKYHFNIDKNQLENNYFLYYFFLQTFCLR